MSWWVAVLLGIIQGVFMFFPVSSTSHLALTQHLLISRGIEIPDPDSPEMILFDLLVHVGTLVSIAVVFRRSISIYIRGTWRGVRQWIGKRKEADQIGRLYLRLSIMGMISVLVTGLIGFPLKSHFESVFAQPLLMSGTLVVTGILLWWTDILPARKIGLRQIGIGMAVIVGIAQGLALLPGLSRSGTTIAFALLAGMKRRWAAEYSFFIAFPTILGAALLQGLEVAAQGGPGSLGIAPMLIGTVVAALVGIVALRLVLALLYRAKFRYFSYYVWFLAIVVAVSSLRGIL